MADRQVMVNRRIISNRRIMPVEGLQLHACLLGPMTTAGADNLCLYRTGGPMRRG